jgi:ATP-dependent Clp protease adaptor protein ClpS
VDVLGQSDVGLGMVLSKARTWKVRALLCPRTGTLRFGRGSLDKARFFFYFAAMAETATPEVLPDIEREQQEKPRSELEPGYLVICWNDPVNFMDYVTHVFQKVFGWQRKKAEFHMLQVHEQGKSVLTRESLEKAEHYVHQLQKYTLHATMERDA